LNRTVISAAATAYIRSTAAVSRKIAEETLVVPIRGKVGDLNCIFSLNPLGSELWNQMQQEFSAAELTDWVLERYDVTPEVAASDVAAFLKDLESVSLIMPAPQELAAAPGHRLEASTCGSSPG
jgi:Coenzyme PQQ synthesis protein D (PqqD)